MFSQRFFFKKEKKTNLHLTITNCVWFYFYVTKCIISPKNYRKKMKNEKNKLLSIFFCCIEKKKREEAVFLCVYLLCHLFLVIHFFFPLCRGKNKMWILFVQIIIGFTSSIIITCGIWLNIMCCCIYYDSSRERESAGKKLDKLKTKLWWT